MSARWFRFYEEVLDDPKVQALSPEDFRGWVNLLCLASRNDGRLPDIKAIAFGLRLDEHGASTLVERLLNATLIDPRSGGSNGMHYAIHAWEKRQFKSDTSTDRVKRYRQRSGNGSRATDSDTDKEKKRKVSNGQVFVARDTPEWTAWQKVKKREGIWSAAHQKNGWWFESQWPASATEEP